MLKPRSVTKAGRMERREGTGGGVRKGGQWRGAREGQSINVYLLSIIEMTKMNMIRDTAHEMWWLRWRMKILS